MNNKYILSACTTVIITFIGCATASRIESFDTQFDGVRIGDSEKKVSEICRSPLLQESTDFSQAEVKTINCSGLDGKPMAFFSIDSKSDRVIEKATWIYRQKNDSNFESELKSRFQNDDWKSYIPCNTRSNEDKILVDSKNGVTIDIGKTGAVVSWSSAIVQSSRIDVILKTCPELQPSIRK